MKKNITILNTYLTLLKYLTILALYTENKTHKQLAISSVNSQTPKSQQKKAKIFIEKISEKIN